MVCCVHCYAVRLIIAFVDVNKTYLILSYLILLFDNVISNGKSYCCNDTFIDVRFTSLPAKNI